MKNGSQKNQKKSQRNKINYVISAIGLCTDGTWFVDYVGNVPEQGGIEFKPGQIYFESLPDAVDFLKSEILMHEERYKEMVKKKLGPNE